MAGKLISQVVTGNSTQSVFTVKQSLIPAGQVLRVRVNGIDVAFSWTNVDTIQLRAAARERSIVDFLADAAPAVTGQSALYNIDFATVNANTSKSAACPIPDAELGDIVNIGLPPNFPAGCTATGVVTAAGTVSLRVQNFTVGNITVPQNVFRVSVSKA
jgi:hypothetical protein